MKSSTSGKGASPKAQKASPKRASKQDSPNAKVSLAYKAAKAEKGNGTIEKQEENYLARCTNFRLTTGYELTICNCKHIRKMTLGERHSIVNPQRWLCGMCYTTDSVWACLSCPSVACGRFIQEHALTHYQESGHPLVIDVNELYVFCYKCDDYVLNDNNSSDIKVLRETLLAIRYQNFTGTTRSGHTLRSAMISEQEDVEMRRQMQQEQLDRDDRLFTAIWHSRFVRQRKSFRRWLRYIRWKRAHKVFPSDSEDEDSITESEIFSDETEESTKTTQAVGLSTEPKPVVPTDESPCPTDSEPAKLTATESEAHTATDQTGEKDVFPCDIEPTAIPEPDFIEPIPTEETQKDDAKIEINAEVENEVTRTSEEQVTLAESMQPNLPTESRLPECVPSEPPKPPAVNVAVMDLPSAVVVLNLQKLPDIPQSRGATEIQLKRKAEDHVPQKEEVRLVTVALPSSSITKLIENNERDEETAETEAKSPEKEENVKEVGRTTPAVLNILSRPKRSTAARRYKEIFSKLIGSNVKEPQAPVAKRPRLSIEEGVKKQKAYMRPAPSGRRSDRIKKINKDKADLLAKKGKSKKKRTLLGQTRKTKTLKNAPTKRSRVRASRAQARKAQKPTLKGLKQAAQAKKDRSRRFVSSGGAVHQRKRLASYRPRSLYDNVPNRAVTSLIPGVTGLRNLGNTCYLNSIIQVLGHLQKFRRCLLALREMEAREAISSSSRNKNENFFFSSTQSKAAHIMSRRTTMELYDEQSKTPPLPGRKSDRLCKTKSGLNGGHSVNESGSTDWDQIAALSPSKKHSGRSPTSAHSSEQLAFSLSLCNELDHLYQVMWSGKWKLVSPYHFLHSVWSLIPSFRGYTQQDAQEFLCELLDKIVSELERCHTNSKSQNKLASRILEVLQGVFEGRLKSRVRCLECGHISSTVEPFWDLSLEFPERYHKVNAMRRRSSVGGKLSSTMSSDPCTLHEMLQNFTAPETLEGGKVYGCTTCNFLQHKATSSTQKKRTSSRKSSQLLTEAEKQLKVLELPQVIRFHLKRFRWIGRNHREKITVHVEFPPELDMRPYCWKNEEDPMPEDIQYMYDLSAVVTHHGRGFGSGHYTAHCWNDIGEFWVHCNDSNLELRSIEDVMLSQAYILFYTQRGLDPHPHILSPPPTPIASPSLPAQPPRECSPVAADPADLKKECSELPQTLGAAVEEKMDGEETSCPSEGSG